MLGALPLSVDPNVLVGFATGDDAAIYRMSDELALALTIDIFTPVVDDPYQFGAIAAANSLSDIYAMGAQPTAMLSFVGFPRGKLPWGDLEQILLGGMEKAKEAGIEVVGGHTIDDPEPKAGYAVIGTVHPDRVVSNAGGRPGDVLILTKPLGSGILTTAIKQGRLGDAEIEEVTRVMAELNRDAADAMMGVGVHAGTDVTGFGFLGHLRQMAATSGVTAVVQAGAVPILPRVRELIEAGVVPGGTRSNEGFLEPFIEWAEVDPATRTALADAQTSGGLLIAVAEDRADELVQRLKDARTLAAARVGRLIEGQPGQVIVEP